jgi:arsenite/tail-anchored protein-transporting ATPase
VRIILFTGKGGVGKTTLAAATALRSAALGQRTLIISTDIAHSLADVLATPLGNEPRPVGMHDLHAAEFDTGEELERYWGDVKRRIAAALRDEGVSATAAGELAILPGLDEVLSLVRLKRYHDEGRYDVLLIDSAPTGAAMRLLSAPDLNRWYARHLLSLSKGLAGAILPALRSVIRLPIGEDAVQQRIQQLFDQVESLRAILTNSAVTSVRLVLNPEHMAVRETQRAYTYMNLFGFAVDALFVNRVLPEEVADPFFARWKADQAAYRQEVRELFAPLPVFEVPLKSHEVVGLEALQQLSHELYGETDPVPPLSSEQPLRFYLEGNRYFLALRVTGVVAGSVELEKQGDELRIRLGHFRRTLALPLYLVGLQPAWAQVEGDYLKIAFEENHR